MLGLGGKGDVWRARLNDVPLRGDFSLPLFPVLGPLLFSGTPVDVQGVDVVDSLDVLVVVVCGGVTDIGRGGEGVENTIIQC